VVPLQRGAGWADAGGLAEAIARAMARDAPGEFVAEMSKARRKGRIFVDYLRNHRGATSVAAYSTRAKPGAPVSTPLAWDELTPELRPDAFTVETLPKRLARQEQDPWQAFGALRQRLTASRLRAAASGR
jgi:bifunctional non-homologous end joining protein LigD